MPGQNPSGAVNPYYYDPNNPFDNITAVVDVPDDQVIENGIEEEDFIENDAAYIITQLRKIGGTQGRGNTDDMTFGTDGNTDGINPYYANKSDQELFDEMKGLFFWTTYLKPNTLRITGEKMINKFKNGPQNPPFSDDELNKAASKSSAMKNFAKDFGDLLNVKLRSVNGNIAQVQNIDIPQNLRPKFNGLYNKFAGLQILVNDTEKTDIHLKNYTIDAASGNWEADLIIEITDHFGLDKNDALAYQNKHGGFWSLVDFTTQKEL